MIKPELKKKRDIRLNVLIEKFQKKLKEAKRMENNKKKAMEYAPNQTNKNTYERSDQKQTHTNEVNVCERKQSQDVVSETSEEVAPLLKRKYK